MKNITKKAMTTAALLLAVKNSRTKVLTMLAAIFFIAWNSTASAANGTWNSNLTISSSVTYDNLMVEGSDRYVIINEGVTVTVIGDLRIVGNVRFYGYGTIHVKHNIDGNIGVGGSVLRIYNGVDLQIGNDDNGLHQIKNFSEFVMYKTVTDYPTLTVRFGGTVQMAQGQGEEGYLFANIGTINCEATVCTGYSGTTLRGSFEGTTKLFAKAGTIEIQGMRVGNILTYFLFMGTAEASNNGMIHLKTSGTGDLDFFGTLTGPGYYVKQVRL